MSTIQLLLSSVHQAMLHCNNIFGITLTLTHTIMQVQVKMPVDFFQEPFGGTQSLTPLSEVNLFSTVQQATLHISLTDMHTFDVKKISNAHPIHCLGMFAKAGIS